MAFTGQLGTSDSRLANIELGGVMPLLQPVDLPELIFEVNWTDDPTAAHRDIVMAGSPIAYWRLNETTGTVAGDESGNGRTGTYTGGFTLGADGALADGDDAVSLNGSTGCVTVGSHSNVFANLTAAYSISTWAYPTATREADPHDAAGVVSYEYSVSPIPFVIAYGRFDSITIFDTRFWAGYYTGSVWVTVTDSTAVTLNEWVHYVLTWDAAADTKKMVLYRNGVEVGSQNPTTPVVAGTSGLSTFIGRRWDTGAAGTDEFFPGRIDDTAIYNRALSPLDAAKLYSSGAVRRSKEDGYVDYSGTVTANGYTTQRIRNASIRRGRSSELDRVEAGALTITVDNRDGAFDPDPANGRIPMRLARLKCRFGYTTYPLLSGYIERIRYLYPGLDADAVAELTITDGFKPLAQQSLSGFLRPAEDVTTRIERILQSSAIPDDQISIDSSYVYAANVAPARSSDTNIELPPIVVTGTLSDGSAVVTGISSTAGIVAGMAVTGNGIPQGATVASVDSGTQITLSTPANIAATKTVQGLPNSAVLYGMSDTSDLSVGMAVDLGNNTDGNPMAQPGSVIQSIDSGSQITMNLPTYNVTFRGPGKPGGYADATFTASATQSLTFQSVTLSVGGALEHIRQIEESELGVFLVTADGTYTYQGSAYRDSRTVIAQFGDTDVTIDIIYSELPITLDDVNVANEYRITNLYNNTVRTIVNPDSVRKYFPKRATSDQVWFSDFYRLRERTEPVPRIDSLTVMPARDPARLWPLVLALEVSDKVEVQRHPQGGGDVLAGYTQFVEGMSHDISSGGWVVTLSVSPEPE